MTLRGTVRYNVLKERIDDDLSKFERGMLR